MEELYRRHAGELRGYLHRRGGPPGADLLADVFVIALQRIDDLPEPAMRRAWLFGTARRLLLASQRESRQRHEAEHQHARSDGPQVHNLVDDRPDKHLTVRQALESLREPDRELIRLTEWEQLGVSEAAMVLGLRPGTARVRLHRARRTLASHPALRALLASRTDNPELERDDSQQVQT
ncbi:RNA polymerase sigma factor [Nocardioides aurantiacus]|uniref:RNA polymerase sigma factor n=1 Tax=Nocardioides aurantiacus TaxID=86796 RepID=UPI001B86432C|nr:sigma-70 family RNA polymerase sigma factor [Nocardioides aurantiacus]